MRNDVSYCNYNEQMTYCPIVFLRHLYNLVIALVFDSSKTQQSFCSFDQLITHLWFVNVM